MIDTVYTTSTQTSIALGHQCGEILNNEVYLSVFEVAGTPSNYHVFARLALHKL